MTDSSSLSITAACKADVPLILSLINELADYERLRHEAVATEASLNEALFGSKPGAEALIARIDGEPAGFALFFHNFSTFLGRRGLYLEDLFVRPTFRGRAIGKSLLSYLAALERLGAKANSAWISYRMSGEALQRLAASRS